MMSASAGFLPAVGAVWWASSPFQSLSPRAAWWLAGAFALAAGLLLAWQQWRRAMAPSRLPVPAWAPASLVFDLTFAYLGFDNLPRLVSGPAGSLALLANLFALRIVIGAALGLYWRDSLLRTTLAKWTVAELLFAVGVVGIATAVPRGLSVDQASAGIVAHGLLLVAAFAWARFLRRPLTSPPAYQLHRGLLLAVALVLVHPWFSPYLVGTGDGMLYHDTLQDFLDQLRAGIWPPWVSQGEVAPFGAVFPFRFATYHYYLCALLNAVSAGCLSTFGVQHLSIVLSFVAGGWIMYSVLRRLCPSRPWLACVFAALYLASPAWLGPLYGFTMIFTIMTLPFVPLALAGAWHAFGAQDAPRAIAHGAVLAAAWHAHMPVGFWISITVLVAQLVGWAVARPGWARIGRQALAWLVCGVLCSGLWWSTISLRLEQAHKAPPGGAESIVRVMRTSFPASILPAGPSPSATSDIQLGYALAAALIIAVIAALLGRRQAWIWILPSFILAGLSLPVPGFTLFAWNLLPSAAREITGLWPIQRLAIPLAGASALAGMLGFAYLSDRSVRWHRTIMAVTAVLVAWSASESIKYLRRGNLTAIASALNEHLLRRENSPLMINWLAFASHRLPEFYLAQTTYDARLYNRVVSEDELRTLVDNYAHVLANSQAPVNLVASPLAPGVWRLLPAFEFQGGQRYLLELAPTAQTVRGTFNMTSPDLARSDTTLFPSGLVQVHAIWTTPRRSQYTEMTYMPTDPALATREVPDFLRFRLLHYEPAKLPISITTFAPYVAQVRTPGPGWLETHRLFTEGYRAQVNGQPAEVAMSLGSRVMIRVPAGSSHVELDYVGPVSLRFAFGLMGSAWLVVISWGFTRWTRSRGVVATMA